MRHFRMCRPNLNKLKKEGYTMFFDMHVHTRLRESTTTWRRILLRVKMLDIGVAITDHDGIANAVKAYDNRGGVPVIPGIEVTSKEGRHLLFYFKTARALDDFYENHLKNRRKKVPLIELISLSKTHDCLFVLPHPLGYFPWHNHIISPHDDIYRPLMDNLDAMETVSGPSTKEQSIRNYTWAKNECLGYTGGSDAHMLSEVGCVLTCAKTKNIDDFFKAVRKGETLVVGLHHSYTLRLFLYPVLFLTRKIFRI